MAKTRIKTTPTRMQKEALMASAAVTTSTNIVTEHVFKVSFIFINNNNVQSRLSTCGSSSRTYATRIDEWLDLPTK